MATRVKIEKVYQLAREDKKFFNSFTRNPQKAIADKGWELSDREAAMMDASRDRCLFTVLDMIKKVRTMGYTWPDGAWKQWP